MSSLQVPANTKIKTACTKEVQHLCPKVQSHTKNNVEKIKRKDVVSALNYFSKVVPSKSKLLSNSVLPSSSGHLPLCEPPWLVQPWPAAGPSWSWLALGLLDMWEASSSFSQKPRLQTPATKTLPDKPNTDGRIISGFFHCTSAFVNALNEGTHLIRSHSVFCLTFFLSFKYNSHASPNPNYSLPILKHLSIILSYFSHKLAVLFGLTFYPESF